MSVAGVVLAAGVSRRLGRSKQLLELNGEMLVERAARVATEAGLSPVVVVVRRDAEFRQVLEAAGYRCVVNEKADEGMAASIRCGVCEVDGVDGVVILPCDQPSLEAAHLGRLMEEPERVTASAYAGVRGIPAYFPAVVFSQLMELRGDVGARGLLREARVVVNEALVFDVDTPEDLARLQG